MKPTAINKLIEWIPSIKWCKGEAEQASMFILDKALSLAKDEESKAADGGCDCCEYKLRAKLSRHEKGAK